MTEHKHYTWFLGGGLLLAVLLWLTFSLPMPVAGQGNSTPTHVPPPARTLPPGVRMTPEPTAVPNNPPPPSENPSTPTPAPVILLPVAGNPSGGVDQVLSIGLVLSGLVLFALGARRVRRSRSA
jgi:hypothetical protein